MPIAECCIRLMTSRSQDGMSMSSPIRRIQVPMVSWLWPNRTSKSDHMVKTRRQRTEGRSSRLIFVLGFTDDFDELPRLLHYGELFAEHGRKSLRKNIDCMAGVVPFRYKLLQPFRIELCPLENVLDSAKPRKIDDLRPKLRTDFTSNLIGRRAHDRLFLLVWHDSRAAHPLPRPRRRLVMNGCHGCNWDNPNDPARTSMQHRCPRVAAAFLIFLPAATRTGIISPDLCAALHGRCVE